MIAYKIVERISDSEYKFLFHDRKKLLKAGTKITAEKKMVYESYDKKTKKKNLYLSGIHVIKTKELCETYLKRFKNIEDKATIEVNAKGCRKKPNGREGVLLADKIVVIGE